MDKRSLFLSLTSSSKGMVCVALALTASVAFLLIGHSGTAKANSELASSANPAVLEFSNSDLYVVQVESLGRAVPVYGTLNPTTQAIVKSTVSGELRQVRVREGERVTRGAVIAEIDTTDARSRLAAALADHGERRARQSIAERNRDTNQTLLQQNFISQNAFDQLQSTYQSSEAAVRWSDAQVDLARKAIDDAVVRAPLSGTVAKRYVNPGERVGVDAPILGIVDLSRMEVEATVAASDIAAVVPGQTVSLRVDGFGGRAFVGTVQRINPMAEPGSRAIRMYVATPNPDGVLRGGMFAQGTMVLARGAATPVVPQSAVFEEAGQSYVFAIEEGKVVKKRVRTGLRDESSGLLAVESGLTDGQVVVRVRMPGLKAGSAAKLPAKTNLPA